MNRRGLVFGVIILLISISSQIYAQDITTATAGPISLSADQNITVEDGGTVTNSDSAPSGVGPPTGVGIYGHDNSGGGGGGNRITVKSGGLVQTNGQGRANAIWVSGNQTDLGAVGFLDGSDANYITIESGGVVKTTGPRPNASWDGPNAIQLGNNNFLRNDGLLLSEGEDGNGIYAAYNNTIENNGTIRTLSDYGQGLYICFNNLITNDGLIETNGDDATAVYLHDDGNKVINTGTIITRGSASFGIHGLDSPNGSTIINNNSIYTYGYNGKAIRSARNSTVINNGLIETIGLGGQGIRAYYDNRVENHGRIVTRGESAMGILTAGGSTVIVTGEIETHGKKGDGVLYWDKDNTLHLSGSISVSGVDAYAIRTGFNGSETNNN
ncbi:MAG: hypothetical protein MI799_09890, partial [Desulfobacterales bacterium]|nr:hypothetical protein [Desulfobacterales bacterium]